MCTTTRTTKTATIRREIRITTDDDFGSHTVMAVIFEQHVGVKTTRSTSDVYVLTRLATDFGVGIRCVKSGSTGDGEARDVLLNAPGGGHTCDCAWGSYGGHKKPCRHIELALLACRERKI
jgi:hypothetical protein